MYQALYRKYRPKNFNEVVGQKIVVKTLINAIVNEKVSHAYIFSGPRGTGKTSIAKIFAKTINCLNQKEGIACEKCSNCIDYNNKKNIDVIEIDAASNNGVDEIRNLKNGVNLVPNTSKYKVYIIDEVHMLSTSAFNALLKTLEEPPAFVIFILATTELYKVPETILSRCQNFSFKRISINDLMSRLKSICVEEKIDITDEAIKLICEYSNGGLRDAIGLLDQLSAYKNELITEDDVNELCGIISNEQMFKLLDSLFDENVKSTISYVNDYNNNGKNLLIIFEKMIENFKNILIYNTASDYFDDELKKNKYDEYLSKVDDAKIYKIIDELNETIKNMKYESNKLLLAQLAIVKISNYLKHKENNIKKLPETVILSQKDTLGNNSEDRKKNITDDPNFNEFKKIRINNTLAQFNKKDFIDFKNNSTQITKYVNNDNYGSYVSLILDGEIKAKGNNYIIYVYSDNSMAILFNNSLWEIEKMFEKIFNTKYNLIALDIQSWEIIKKDFNNSLKLGNNKYKLKNEIELKYQKKEEKTKLNDIDNMFSEIVKYE